MIKIKTLLLSFMLLITCKAPNIEQTKQIDQIGGTTNSIIEVAGEQSVGGVTSQTTTTSIEQSELDVLMCADTNGF